MSGDPRAAHRIDWNGRPFFLKFEASDVAVWEREVGKTFQSVLRSPAEQMGFFELLKAVMVGIKHHWVGASDLPPLDDEFLNTGFRSYRLGFTHLQQTVINAMSSCVPIDRTASKPTALPPQGVQPPFDVDIPTKTTTPGSTGTSASEKQPESD